MNLKRLKDVTSDARPSLGKGEGEGHDTRWGGCVDDTHDPHLMTVGTQRMSCWAEVKGAAIDASASDREIPAIAAFKACHKENTPQPKAATTPV